MKAKDTVMRDLELWERFGIGKLGIGDWLREVLEAQAEISFKAGAKAMYDLLTNGKYTEIQFLKKNYPAFKALSLELLFGKLS